MNDLPSFSLQGKVIVLCGGGGALGAAFLTALGGAGAKVIVTSRQRVAAEAMAATARTAGYDVTGDELGLEKEAAILAFRDRVMSAHGRIDGLVYNAVSRPMKSFGDDLANWEASMATNATGYFAVVRALGDAMANGKQGSIVAISSRYGLTGVNPWLYEGTPLLDPPDYFFHKAGMINLTRYLATYYGPRGVRVNVVAPGGISSPDRPQPGDYVDRHARMTALGRLADPGEMTGAVVFLLSAAASYITGATITIDGGYTSR